VIWQKNVLTLGLANTTQSVAGYKVSPAYSIKSHHVFLSPWIESRSREWSVTIYHIEILTIVQDMKCIKYCIILDRAYSLVVVQLACWYTDVSRLNWVQLWWLSPFHRRRHCWCAHASPLANFQCSHQYMSESDTYVYTHFLHRKCYLSLLSQPVSVLSDSACARIYIYTSMYTYT